MAFFCALEPAAVRLPDGQPAAEAELEPPPVVGAALLSVPQAVSASAEASATATRLPVLVTFTLLGPPCAALDLRRGRSRAGRISPSQLTLGAARGRSPA